APRNVSAAGAGGHRHPRPADAVGFLDRARHRRTQAAAALSRRGNARGAAGCAIPRSATTAERARARRGFRRRRASAHDRRSDDRRAPFPGPHAIGGHGRAARRCFRPGHADESAQHHRRSISELAAQAERAARILGVEPSFWSAHPDAAQGKAAAGAARPASRRGRPQVARPLRGMNIPRATYRVQLHRDFGFADAAALVPYLAALGISHIYLSPWLKARPGSTHGYDIVDHSQLNPELGSEDDFAALAAALAAPGIAQMADIVPNHMGFMGSDNVWWLDVLENGRASQYAGYFDID